MNTLLLSSLEDQDVENTMFDRIFLHVSNKLTYDIKGPSKERVRRGGTPQSQTIMSPTFSLRICVSFYTYTIGVLRV